MAEAAGTTVLAGPVLEDARQETFVRVLTTLKQRGGLDRPETLGAFVNSVCNNVLFRLLPIAEEDRPGPRRRARAG